MTIIRKIFDASISFKNFVGRKKRELRELSKYVVAFKGRTGARSKAGQCLEKGDVLGFWAEAAKCPDTDMLIDQLYLDWLMINMPHFETK